MSKYPISVSASFAITQTFLITGNICYGYGIFTSCIFFYLSTEARSNWALWLSTTFPNLLGWCKPSKKHDIQDGMPGMDAKSSHRPGRSPRSIYATDDRWDTSIRPHSRSAAPDPLIRRLTAASLSPACQHRGTHLAARARARSIELDQCAAATLKMTRRRSRPAQIMAVRATPRRGQHTVTHVKCR